VSIAKPADFSQIVVSKELRDGLPEVNRLANGEPSDAKQLKASNLRDVGDAHDNRVP